MVSPQLSAVFQCPIYDMIAFLVILPRITEGLLLMVSGNCVLGPFVI
jgi:hypothetical protein